MSATTCDRAAATACGACSFRAEGSQEWLYLLLLLEFQSTVDRYMAARVLSYTAQTFLKLIRGGQLAADGLLPPLLPVVIYSGSGRWSAPREASELVAEAGPGLAPFQPRQRYLLLDQGAVDEDTLPSGNLLSAQIGLGRASVPGMSAALGTRRGSFGRLRPRDVASGLRGDGASTGGSQPCGVVATGLAAALRSLAQAGDLNAMASTLGENIDHYVEQRSESAFKQGVERGIGEGLEHERALLLRQAARKFDAETVARLSVLLERIDDPERFADIGEDLMDCATGAELLARAEGATGRA